MTEKKALLTPVDKQPNNRNYPARTFVLQD